ncbi:MAG: histidine phosphatase family protein [Actinomycetota bacterium]
MTTNGAPPDPAYRVRVLLLRHGQVPHHKGDVPLTDLGVAQADAAGRWFGREGFEVAGLLSGETTRTRDTAEVFAEGVRAEGGVIPDPMVSFALRNPDLYLGGHRINLAQGAEALAAQSPSTEPDDVEASLFYAELMAAPDRVGYWLEHPDPPGDDAAAVGVRIDRFARSLADVPAWRGRTVVGMTHSPVLRAVRFRHEGVYTREPPFLHGYSLTLGHDGHLRFDTVTTDTGDIPATSRPGPGVVRPEDEPPEKEDHTR